MPDNIATAIDAATAAARSDILAALQTGAPGPVGQVGHGAIRLRGRDDPPPAAIQASLGEPAEDSPGEPAPAEPQHAGHGTIRLR